MKKCACVGDYCEQIITFPLLRNNLYNVKKVLVPCLQLRAARHSFVRPQSYDRRE